MVGGIRLSGTGATEVEVSMAEGMKGWERCANASAAGIPLLVKRAEKSFRNSDAPPAAVMGRLLCDGNGEVPLRWKYGGVYGPAPILSFVRADGVPFGLDAWDLLVLFLARVETEEDAVESRVECEAKGGAEAARVDAVGDDPSEAEDGKEGSESEGGEVYPDEEGEEGWKGWQEDSHAPAVVNVTRPRIDRESFLRFVASSAVIEGNIPGIRLGLGEEFPTGSAVKLCDLETRPELNGRKATVVGHSGRGRVRVCVDSDPSPIAVRPSCCLTFPCPELAEPESSNCAEAGSDQD
jgi:hypothetical protein